MSSHIQPSRKGKEPARSSKYDPTVATSSGSLLESAQSSGEFRRTHGSDYGARHHHRQFEVNRGDAPRGRSSTQHGHFDPEHVTVRVEEGRVTGYEGGSDHSSDSCIVRAHAAGHRSKQRQSQVSKDLMRTKHQDEVNQIQRRNRQDKKSNSKSAHGNGCCVIM